MVETRFFAYHSPSFLYIYLISSSTNLLNRRRCDRNIINLLTWKTRRHI